MARHDLKDRDMKRWWLGLLMAAVAMTTLPDDAFAKRLGGGRPAGLQRQMPAAPAKPMQADSARPGSPTQGAQQQAPSPAPMGAAAGANAGKRSWLGPIAGLAAGLGLAALASHFGFGEGLANVMMILLLGAAAFFALRWILSRMGGAKAAPAGLKPSYASAGGPAAEPLPTQAPLQRNNLSSGSSGNGGFLSAAQSFSPETTGPALRLPDGFDQAGFERAAKMIFIRMQAANDAGNLDDLRQFTTPEMFAAIRLDLQDRGNQTQQTDVEELHAQILHADDEAQRLIVSVRFHGRIREEIGQHAADPFDEIWHLVREHGQEQWRIAGIQPTQPN